MNMDMGYGIWDMGFVCGYRQREGEKKEVITGKESKEENEKKNEKVRKSELATKRERERAGHAEPRYAARGIRRAQHAQHVQQARSVTRYNR